MLRLRDEMEHLSGVSQPVSRRRFLILTSGGILASCAFPSVTALSRTLPQDQTTHNPDPKDWDPTTLTATWIGHSTTLMNFFGTTLLTDPVLTDKVGLDVFGLFVYGPERITQPALRFGQLPPIDVILISHAHMDHMDLRTLRSFDRSMTMIVPANTADILEDQGFRNVLELDWGESTTVCEATVEALQVNHNGARFPWEHARSEEYADGRSCNGYLISKNNVHVVYAGDTAYCEYFKPLRDRFSTIDLAIMPIGGYDPWESRHATPEQSVEMCKQMGARVILPIHWETFVSTRENVMEPMERLLVALGNGDIQLALDSLGAVWTLREQQLHDHPNGN